MNLEPIRALLELGKREATTTFQSIEAEKALVESLPALSQLLEAVTNLEKLAEQWDSPKVIIDAEYAASEIKRLLHPEDTK